jgi:hypothetical protein
MTDVLKAFVPADVAGLPKPSFAVVQAELLPAGIGGYVGIRTHGAIATIERHAVRLKALVRYSLWGPDPLAVDNAVGALNAAVLSDATLAPSGFLRLTFDGTVASEQTATNVWRRFADYHVLYEFPYDADDSASLIVRIPVDETTTSESITITGDIARWDNKHAPVFSMRGPATYTGLAALAFVFDAALPPTGAVQIVRTFDGAPPPTPVLDFPTFVAQITATSSPARNLSLTFAKIGDLLALFSADPDSVPLGDWNEDGNVDHYVSSRFVFAQPLVLASVADRLELSYTPSPFDQTAVVYLRATRQGD